MPFNVDPSCPENSRTIIKWQFPGQPETENSDGDDYKIEKYPKLEGGQRTWITYEIGRRVVKYNYFTGEVTEIKDDIFTRDNDFFVPVGKEPAGEFFVNFYKKQSSPDNFHKQFLVLYPTKAGGFSGVDGLNFIGQGGSGGSTGFRAGSFKLLYVYQPYATKPLTYAYKIDIYKDGNVIATDEGDYEPEVT